MMKKLPVFHTEQDALWYHTAISQLRTITARHRAAEIQLKSKVTLNWGQQKGLEKNSYELGAGCVTSVAPADPDCRTPTLP